MRIQDLIGRGVEITLLDGSTYTLLYDLEAMAMLEDAMDEETVLSRKLRDMFERKNASWRAVLFLLWLGLRHHHPDVTQEAVAKLVDVRMMAYVVEKITEALGLAMPEGESAPAGKKTSQDGFPGQSSTSSPGGLE